MSGTDELIGKRVGGYEIIGLVGKGGMAAVYTAHQVSMLNRVVALKVLPRQFLNEESYMVRFNREVRIVAQLEHRNIVPVYDYGEQDSQPFIVMRYMSGGSVDDLLNAGALTLHKMLNIVEQIAPALDYAHSKQVLHRDMKPSNVLMDDNGGAYLTDFGIARIMGDPTISTATQGVIGTPSYMSPEQAQGFALDNRSDLYSLGVMMYEMATGRRPFESDTPYGVAVMHVTAPPPPPRSLNPALSDAVENVILTAIRKRKEDRYPDAVALAEALKRAVQGGAYIAPPTKGDTQPMLKQSANLDTPLPDEDTAPTPPVQPISSIPSPSEAYSGAPVSPIFDSSSSVSRISAPAPPLPMTSAPVVQSIPPSVPLAPPAVMSSVPPGQFSDSMLQPMPPVPYPVAPDPRRRRKRGGVLMSALAGIAIGFTLLSLVILVALLVIGQTNREESRLRAAATDAAETAAAQVTDDPGGTPERSTRSGSVIQAFTATFTPTLSASATLSPTFAPSGEVTDEPSSIRDLSGQIIFFAERGAVGARDFNLYSLDLADAREIRLTATAYAEVFPASAAEGELVAFVADRDNDFDIYVLNARTLSVRKLTQNDVVDRAPSWSPDGSWLVFSSEVDGDSTSDLYRIDADGSNLEKLHDSDERASDPVYTRSGRFLLFTEGDAADAATWEIMRLDTTDGSVIALTDNDHKDWSPALAPDGSVIYLTENVDGETALGYSAIAGVSINGENRQVLYDGDGYESSLAYSPEGRLLLFTSDATGRDELYVIERSALGRSDAEPDRVTSLGGAGGVWLSPSS